MILHLTVKKKWFDMIASGEKKEEYREIKEYWCNRFYSFFGSFGHGADFKEWDFVRFKNGYAKDAPTIDVEFLGIDRSSNGQPDWGFTGRCFVIKLGKIKQQGTL